MDAEEKVIGHFPKAEAREEPAIFKHGAAHPIERGHWAIFADSDLDGNELGSGKTESLAWKDAARKLPTLTVAAR